MVYPLLISSTMVFLTVRMHDLITLLEKLYNINWGCAENSFVYIYYIAIVSYCGMLGIWMITSDERDRKIIRNLLDFSRIWTSLCLYGICFYTFLGTFSGLLFLPLLIVTTASLLCSIVVGVRCHQALYITTQLSWKSYLINVMIGIIWFIISIYQGYLQMIVIIEN